VEVEAGSASEWEVTCNKDSYKLYHDGNEEGEVGERRKQRR
jgi:hypothetical protein